MSGSERLVLPKETRGLGQLRSCLILMRLQAPSEAVVDSQFHAPGATRDLAILGGRGNHARAVEIDGSVGKILKTTNLYLQLL